MKQVALTQGKFAFVSDEDLAKVMTFRPEVPWSYKEHHAGYTAYAYKFYRLGDRSVAIPMQNVILGPPPEGFTWDHADHNGLNNQRDNLRLASNEEQTQHRRKPKHNSSGAKDVYWSKERGAWRVRVVANKKATYKDFKTFEEAVEGRNKLVAQIHGSFACLDRPNRGVNGESPTP